MVILNKLKHTITGFELPFYYLWCGETISLLGIALMQFSLGVWVYQETGSVLDFSGVIAATILPALLILPFGGKVADHFDRRYIMVTADVVTALLIFLLAALLWNEALELKHLYIFNVLAALAGSFRSASYAVSVSELVSRDKYTQASGLIGMSANLVSMFAPLLAGWLMSELGLAGIVYIDVIAFCLGSLFILKAFFSYEKTKNKAVLTEPPSDEGSIAVTIRFFKQQPLMFGLFFYVILLNAAISLVSIMLLPLILSHHTPRELGLVLSFGAIGGFLGTMFLATVQPPKNLMNTVLKGDVFISCCVLLIGLSTNLILYCIYTFLAVFIASFVKGCSQALWMTKVPFQIRGRIFSVLAAAILATSLAMLLFAGTTTDHFLEPALSSNGFLFRTIGPWIGVGKGRGLGLLFIICGAFGIVIALSALKTRLNNLDFQVPDAH